MRVKQAWGYQGKWEQLEENTFQPSTTIPNTPVEILIGW